MYCRNCGKEINENAVICMNCGCVTGNMKPAWQDAPSVGYAILGFFLPLIGFILYLTWKREFPLRARSAGKGTLIGVIFGFVYVIFITVLVVVGTVSSSYY